MKMKRIIVLAWVVLAFVGIVKGQDGYSTSYFLSNLPQQYRLNPAYQPEYKVFIGLPVLSGISLNYLNSSFTPEDLLVKRNDSVFVDINKFYKKLNKRNFISFSNENSILSVGVKAKSWYGTLDITQRNDFMFRANKDLFTFLKEGNMGHPDMDFGKLGLVGSSYLEVALGLSKQINSKLTIGGRVKYLMGIANVDMTDSEMGISTKVDRIELHSKQKIRATMPIELQYKELANGYVDWDGFDVNTDNVSVSSFISPKNSGFGLDLGGEYQFNDKIKLFASLTDLGFIHWGANTYAFDQDATFDWQGADISNSMNDSNEGYVDLDDQFDRLTDSLKNTFRLKKAGNTYTTMLSPKLHLGTTYQLNKMFNVSGLFKGTLVDGMFIPSLTAAANARLLRNVSASVSYSITRGSYVNVGAGLTAKLGPVQLYVATDNLLACNYTNTQTASARFGINLLFGHKDKKKKKVEEEKPEEIIIAPIPPKKDTVQKDTMKHIQDTIVPPLREEKATVTEGAIKACYVIVGSFKSKQKAEVLRKKLIFMGFKNSALLQNESGMYRVSAASYDSHAACWDEVFRVRKEYPQFSDAWGLTIRE